MPEMEQPARRDAWLHKPWFWIALLGWLWATGMALPIFTGYRPPIQLGFFAITWKPLLLAWQAYLVPVIVALPLILPVGQFEKRCKCSFILALLSIIVLYNAFFWVAIPYSLPISAKVVGTGLLAPLLSLGVHPDFANIVGAVVILLFVAIARTAPRLSTNRLLWALGFFLLVAAVTLPGCTDRNLLPSF